MAEPWTQGREQLRVLQIARARVVSSGRAGTHDISTRARIGQTLVLKLEDGQGKSKAVEVAR